MQTIVFSTKKYLTKVETSKITEIKDIWYIKGEWKHTNPRTQQTRLNPFRKSPFRKRTLESVLNEAMRGSQYLLCKTRPSLVTAHSEIQVSCSSVNAFFSTSSTLKKITAAELCKLNRLINQH